MIQQFVNHKIIAKFAQKIKPLMEYKKEQQIKFDIVSESQLAFTYPQDNTKEKKLKIRSFLVAAVWT